MRTAFIGPWWSFSAYNFRFNIKSECNEWLYLKNPSNTSNPNQIWPSSPVFFLTAAIILILLSYFALTAWSDIIWMIGWKLQWNNTPFIMQQHKKMFDVKLKIIINITTKIYHCHCYIIREKILQMHDLKDILKQHEDQIWGFRASKAILCIHAQTTR